MAKAIDKTTIIAIAVLAEERTRLHGRVEMVAKLTTAHWEEVHAALMAKLATAGYAVALGPEQRFGFVDIHVRRTNDVNQPFVRVVRMVPESSYHGGHSGSNGYAVTSKSHGLGSRRYLFDVALAQSATVWTYTFSMNWQKLLGAIEEELKIVERAHQWKMERDRVDGVADALRRRLLPQANRLALFTDAKRVIVETQQSSAEPPLFAVRVEFAERSHYAVTAAALLPFLQRFPDAVVETVYSGVLLKSMTVEQIEAALADLPVPA